MGWAQEAAEAVFGMKGEEKRRTVVRQGRREQWEGWQRLLTDQRETLKKKREYTMDPVIQKAIRQQIRLTSREINRGKMGLKYSDRG